MNMKNCRYYIWITCLLLFLSMPMVKAEGQIIIDGEFDDWKGLSIEYKNLNESFSKGAAVEDDQYLYIYVQANRSDNVQLSNGGEFTLKNGEEQKKLVATSIDNQFNVVIKDINYLQIVEASAKGDIVDNLATWELAIPKSFSGDCTEVIFTNISMEVKHISELQKPDQNEPDQGEVPDESGTPDESEQPDQSEGEDNQGGNTGSGIIIDGYYDDWMNWKHFELKWQNNVIANACAIRQEDQICVHVGTTYYRTDRHLNLDNIRIHINGDPKDGAQIKLRQVDANGNISTEPLNMIEDNKRYPLVALINRDGVNYVLGDAYYTTKQSQDREDFEFCFNLDVLEKALNLKLDTKDQISLTFPSIGDGSIIIEGTSSGPWLIVGLCALVALGGIYMAKKKELQ